MCVLEDPEDGPGAIAWVHQGKEESFLVPRTGDVFGMKIENSKEHGRLKIVYNHVLYVVILLYIYIVVTMFTTCTLR